MLLRSWPNRVYIHWWKPADFLWALHTFFIYVYCRLILPSFKVTKYVSQITCNQSISNALDFLHPLILPDFTNFTAHLSKTHGFRFFIVPYGIFPGKVLSKLGGVFSFSFSSVHAFINPVSNSDISVLFNLWQIRTGHTTVHSEFPFHCKLLICLYKSHNPFCCWWKICVPNKWYTRY